MKKISKITRKGLIAASLVGLIITVSSNANADSGFSDIVEGARVYVGAGVGYNHYSLAGDFKNVINGNNKGSVKSKSADALLPIVGVKFRDNFGLEFGYAFHNKLKISGKNSASVKIRNAFVDIMGYMPMASQIDLVGGLGFGRVVITGDNSTAALAMGGTSYNKFGLRAKIGAQYNINDHIGVRGLVGYQQIGNKDCKRAIKNMQSANIDVMYLI